MNRKTLLFLIIGLFVLTTLAIAVSAAETPNALESIFAPFGSRLEQVYYKFSPFIDAMIYLVIFLGLAQVTIGHRFEARKGGRAVTIGVGLILAIGLAVWETRAGFNIASFGPVAGIILLALMGYAIWSGITTLEIEGVDKLTVAAIAYILVYYSMAATVPSMIGWINQNVPVVGGLLALIAAALTVYLIVKIVVWIISLFGGGGGGTTPPGGGTTPPGGETPPGGAVGPKPGKPAKPGEPEKEEKPGDIDELKNVEKDLLNARNALIHLRDTGTKNFLESVNLWVHQWNQNKDRNAAKSNARRVRTSVEENLQKAHRAAMHHIKLAASASAACARMNKYASEKDEINSLAASIESINERNSMKTRIPHAFDHYLLILYRFIEGKYDPIHRKRGGKRAETPVTLKNVIIHQQQTSVRGALTGFIKDALDWVETNIDNLMKIMKRLQK